MPHFVVPPSQIHGERAVITGGDVHHIETVLRLKPGDTLTLLDGQGQRYAARLVALGPEIELAITGAEPVTEPNPVELVLAQGVLKGERMEWVIQKAVELGARRIVPLLTERTIPKLEGENKLVRWRKIADEALKQCGRAETVPIDPPQTLAACLAVFGPEYVKLMPWEGETAMRVKNVMQDTGVGTDLRNRPIFGLHKLLAVVGPEGGLSEAEIVQARNAGFITVTLGKRVLRAETAAVTFLSLVQYELGNI